MNDCIDMKRNPAIDDAAKLLEISGFVKMADLAELLEVKGRYDALVTYVKNFSRTLIEKEICAAILGVDLSEEENK